MRFQDVSAVNGKSVTWRHLPESGTLAKKTMKVFVAKLTENGSYRHPYWNSTRGEATFTSSFNTCYFENRVYRKLKGGWRGGNYYGVEDGEIYRISQIKP